MMFVTMLNRLFLAYLIGSVSSLIAQLDRQANANADKLDVLKEYMYWRRTPKELRIRIRRYFEFFYQRQPVFDEVGRHTHGPNTRHSPLLLLCSAHTDGSRPKGDYAGKSWEQTRF